MKRIIAAVLCTLAMLGFIAALYACFWLKVAVIGAGALVAVCVIGVLFWQALGDIKFLQ